MTDIRRAPVAERVAAYTDKTTASGCWEWRGVRRANGYGTLMVNYKSRLAHREAYRLAHGPIPEGLFVCHTCDNRACVNPDHLFLGTAKDKCLTRRIKATAPLCLVSAIQCRS
jgi:hypothetical protein